MTETKIAEIKIIADAMTDVIIKMPLEIDMTTLSGVIARLHKISKTFFNEASILTPSQKVSQIGKPKTAYHSWTEEENKLILQMHNEGKSYVEIKDFFSSRTGIDISKETVYNRISALKLGKISMSKSNSANSHWTDEENALILKMREEGKPYKEIGDYFTPIKGKPISGDLMFQRVKKLRGNAQNEN